MSETCEHVWHVVPSLVSAKRLGMEGAETVILAFLADDHFVQLQCEKCREYAAARNTLPITGPVPRAPSVSTLQELIPYGLGADGWSAVD